MLYSVRKCIGEAWKKIMNRKGGTKWEVKVGFDGMCTHNQSLKVTTLFWMGTESDVCASR